MREDDLIPQLPYLVGPKLFELDLFTLRMQNHIAPVECHELHMPLTNIFRRAFEASDSPEEKELLATCNPNKVRTSDRVYNSELTPPELT